MEDAKQIVDELGALREDLAQRHSENVTAAGVADRKLDEVIRRVDDLHKAFPGGDWDGHRRYHETLIERAEARAKFYNDLRAELAKKGVWALIALIGIALWQYFKSKVIA
ncbi:hypothetical protein [Paraburkholderia tropica]|uniref:hypothetical protein n=1 Tax=Paraburkholderia tropica TaxID=92647 RepID=UPI003D26B39E